MPANIRKRPDTRFLADTNLSSITTDLSQRHTNLTAAAPGGYEANSDRTAIDGQGRGRAIEVACLIDAASSGVLVDHNNGDGYRITVGAGGSVAFSDVTGTIVTITAPNIDAGLRAYVIAWSIEPNPIPTGAGDLFRSEFVVWCDEAGFEGLEWDAVNHGFAAADPSGTFTVGGVYTGGAMTLAYSDTIDIVRISCRFHTRTETREHFVQQTSAPVVVGIQACEAPRIPAQLIEPGMPIGPAYQMAAASMKTGRNRHRLLSPLWNVMIPAPATFSDDMAAVLGHKLVYNMPGGGGWQSPYWIARRQVPRTCQHVRVVLQFVTFKKNPMLAMDPVEVRFHTSNNRPDLATKDSHILVSRSVDDVNAMALGVLHVFADFCFVERANDGFTWFSWSIRTDGGSGSGNASYAIRGWSVTPVVLSEGYGGLPPNNWGP